MREPQLGDEVHCSGRAHGRITMVTEYEGVVVIGVMYAGARRKEWHPMSQLAWDRDHWVVKE